MPQFWEFFAGGGMVRAGLGSGWGCLFANDFDPKKSRVYIDNWGPGELKTADVRALNPADLPGRADLAWASFPCQDLSLAGAGAGLKGARSGSFWPFWNLARGVIAEGHAPRLIVLENVCGALNSHEGGDFVDICAALQSAGYRTGALVVDAELFVPQSRPRLFIVCAHVDTDLPESSYGNSPALPWHTRALRTAYQKLSAQQRRHWIWWKLPLPTLRSATLLDLIEERSPEASWFSETETRRLIAMMSGVNRAKLEWAQRENRRMAGTVYRRTRHDGYGRRVQRAEVRFDGVSGCLRTPGGGSSRQTILLVDGPSIRARLISSRETARLMGLPDSYQLPPNYNEAYHLTGDGVVVPVVRHLAEHIFEPVLAHAEAGVTAAA